MSESDSVAGLAAVVTGASRGIGLATARALASAGMRVVLLARGGPALDAAARATAGDARAVPCDLTAPVDIDAAAAHIERLLPGGVDVLVNNAGAFVLGRVDELVAGDVERTLRLNVLAPVRLARLLLPGMRRRGRGHVVTIGSIADRQVFPENAAYAASKHALRAVHEVLRLETRGTGVRATLVSPGPVDTPLWDAIGPDERAGFTPRAAMLGAGAVADAVVWAVTRAPGVNIDELRLSRA